MDESEEDDDSSSQSGGFYSQPKAVKQDNNGPLVANYGAPPKRHNYQSTGDDSFDPNQNNKKGRGYLD